MKKYFINSEEKSRTDFFRQLKADCYREKEGHPLPNGLGCVTFREHDPKRYQKTLRNLRRGHIVVMLSAGRSYAVKEE